MALAQHRDTLIPAFNHLANSDLKIEELLSVHARVKLLSAGQFPSVVDLDLGSLGADRPSAPRIEHLYLEARGVVFNGKRVHHLLFWSSSLGLGAVSRGNDVNHQLLVEVVIDQGLLIDFIEERVLLLLHYLFELDDLLLKISELGRSKILSLVLEKQINWGP